MKTAMRSRKSAVVGNSRWTAYATAGAATALAGVNIAEADIHHVTVNHAYAPAAGSSTISVFSLGAGAQFTIRAFLHTAGNTHSGQINGHASFGVFAGAGNLASFKGYASGSAHYVSKLASGVNINGGGFVSNGGYFAYLARHQFGQFTTPGIGFVGIQFNTGSGIEYGWVRFNMNGGPSNRFTLVDYAWGDPGTAIKTGQTTVPEPGSLGLLALGGAGLLAWRQRRTKNAAAA